MAIPSNPDFDDIDLLKSQLRHEGYEDSDENVANFMLNKETNTSPELGLSPKPSEPNLGEEFKRALLSVSGIQVAQFAGNAIGFALQRWEASKVAFAKGAGFTAPLGFMGLEKTEFPDAKRRNSDNAELGDIFRKMGLPEGVSATAGFIADLADPLFLLPVKYYKGAAQSVLSGNALKALNEAKTFKQWKDTISKTPLAKDVSGYLDKAEWYAKFKEKFLEWRSTELANYAKEAIQGKGLLDGMTVEQKSVFRHLDNAQIVDNLGASDAARVIRYVMKEASPEQLETLTHILTKKTPVGMVPGIANVDLKAVKAMYHMKDIIAKNSVKIADELDLLKQYNPEAVAKIVEQEVIKISGQKPPIDPLINKIREKAGTYLRRVFSIFDSDFNPKSITPELKTAVSEELQQKLQMTAKEAEDYIDNLITKKEAEYVRPAYTLRIRKSALLSRGDEIDDLPKLRELMGEIKDPVERALRTVESQTQIAAKLRAYRQLFEMGKVGPKSATLTEKVPPGDIFDWGVMAGMYVDKETMKVIQIAKKIQESYERPLNKFFRGIKTIKTIGEPPFVFVRNPIANVIAVAVGDPGLLSDTKLTRAVLSALYSNVFKKPTPDELQKLPKILREPLEAGAIGNELPLKYEIEDVFGTIGDLAKSKGFNIDQYLSAPKKMFEFMKKATVTGDQFFKIMHYWRSRLGRTGKGKLAIPDAVEAVHKILPMYSEPNRIAILARNNPWAMTLLNPFLTFRFEMYRIMLNWFKDPEMAPRAALLLSAPMVWNSMVMGLSGRSMQDINETVMMKPELLSTTFLNPLSPDFDVNTEYLNPVNAKGLFAPLMALSGATGVNPLDFMLDFTTFNPEFGFQNLLISPIETGLLGRGPQGQELNFNQRMSELIKTLGPSSITRHLPGALSEQAEIQENARRLLRAVGIPVEERNAKYNRPKVGKQVYKRLSQGANPEPILNALNTLGYDGENLMKNAARKIQKERNKEDKREKRQGLLGIG